MTIPVDAMGGAHHEPTRSEDAAPAGFGKVERSLERRRSRFGQRRPGFSTSTIWTIGYVLATPDVARRPTIRCPRLSSMGLELRDDLECCLDALETPSPGAGRRMSLAPSPPTRPAAGAARARKLLGQEQLCYPGEAGLNIRGLPGEQRASSRVTRSRGGTSERRATGWPAVGDVAETIADGLASETTDS